MSGNLFRVVLILLSCNTSDNNNSFLVHIFSLPGPSYFIYGEFVGMVADNPDQKIELKTFCCEIVNNHKALAAEQAAYKEIPKISNVTQKEVLENYFQIKKDVGEIIHREMERMLDTPSLSDLIINK